MTKQYKLTIYVKIYSDIMTAVFTCSSRKAAEQKYLKIKDNFSDIIKYTITEVKDEQD